MLGWLLRTLLHQKHRTVLKIALYVVKAGVFAARMLDSPQWRSARIQPPLPSADVAGRQQPGEVHARLGQRSCPPNDRGSCASERRCVRRRRQCEIARVRALYGAGAVETSDELGKTRCDPLMQLASNAGRRLRLAETHAVSSEVFAADGGDVGWSTRRPERSDCADEVIAG